LADNLLFKSEILLNKELILDEHELELTNKDNKKENKIYRDNKDYDAYKREGCKQCAKCKEY
jgi:hypothetical protein